MLFFTVLLSACGGVDGVDDIPPPLPTFVNQTYPEQDAESVVEYGVIEILFNKDMDSSSLRSAFTLQDDNGESIDGTFYYRERTSCIFLLGCMDIYEAKFSSDKHLKPSVTYTATLSSDVRYEDGTPVKAEFSWDFTTRDVPDVGNWQNISTTGALTSRKLHTAIWTGSKMIIWGGKDIGGSLNSGDQYNPFTDIWEPISTQNAPARRYNHTAVWTGSEMIVWGGRGEDGVYLNTGGRYNPFSDTWEPISILEAPSSRNGHTAVWTGSEMIVWGGKNALFFLNTGARYNPVTDTWQAINPGVPINGRGFHTTVWTGTEMIIWGGLSENFSQGQFKLNSGLKFNLANDTWEDISTAEAPSRRYQHTAVWTGLEMIVWGGENHYEDFFNTGGRFNPITNSWKLVSTQNAPSARSSHTAIWTGSKMIIWGGDTKFSTLPYREIFLYSHTGGIFNAFNNTWQPTSITNSPVGKSSHTAIWTGSEMIVWKGRGGKYSPF